MYLAFDAFCDVRKGSEEREKGGKAVVFTALGWAVVEWKLESER